MKVNQLDKIRLFSTTSPTLQGCVGVEQFLRWNDGIFSVILHLAQTINEPTYPHPHGNLTIILSNNRPHPEVVGSLFVLTDLPT